MPRGPFKMLARTADPIKHWYWGYIIHDMQGFKSAKQVITVDYCHDPREVIGVTKTQTASDAGLEITGELIAFAEKDRAAEVLFRMSEGTPYQSSMDWEYDRVEFLEPQARTTVNGREVVGPMYIVREWTNEAVAVCPHGADSGTSTDTAGEFQRDFTLFSSGVPKMPQPATPPNPETPPPANPTTFKAEPPAPDKNAIAAEIRAELTKFTTKFGAENGTKWFGEGKSYAESLELHAGVLEARAISAETRFAAAEEKLKSIGRGEAAPASATDFEKPAQPGKPTVNGHLGTSFAKFAGVKLPGQP